ncbi:MAG: hypothetical protein LBL53_00990 [Endomicrobium sp.]|jgi:hypothetical protein|nr:hypothetical protein [Endomicrobium sp.]
MQNKYNTLYKVIFFILCNFCYISVNAASTSKAINHFKINNYDSINITYKEITKIKNNYSKNGKLLRTNITKSGKILVNDAKKHKS